MALNVRLSPELDTLARAYCERVGISLNGLVGVALDAYLQRGQVDAAVPVAPVQRVQPDPQPVLSSQASAEPAPKPERVKPTFTAAPWVPPDPKPTLPANPTKADRQKLTNWHRRQSIS